MGYWIKCTDVHGIETNVNLDLVLAVQRFPTEQVTRLYTPAAIAEPKALIFVKDTPEQIMAQLPKASR